MGKKSKFLYWFGCEKCQYVAPKNEEKSNLNWSFYDSGPCPICGEDMATVLGEPPEQNKIVEEKSLNDFLTIIREDESITEVENPFEPIKLVILGRLLRFGTILELIKDGTFTKEDAKELLNGPLDPDDQTTVYDDSGLVDCESIEEAEKIIKYGRDSLCSTEN